MTLSNIKILDFSRILAAPFASMILGDLGAEVWKIEKPGVGDEVRNWVPPSINGQSCYFLCANRNKKSIAINLGHKKGQELALRLTRKADILLENFKVSQMEKFGLSYDQIVKENPSLIYCSIMGYGRTGPYSHDPGYDVIAGAIGGLMSITGPKSGEPCKPGVALIDLLTGLYAHGAILAALLERERNGGLGQRIDCNLLSTQIAALANIGSNFLNTGLEGRPLGTEHESIVPYQAFETKDGRFYVIGAASDDAFRELCRLLDLPALSESQLYQTNKDRIENRDALLRILSDKFRSETFQYWTKTLRNRKFPSGPVNSLSEAYEHEQVKHLNLVQEVAHKKYGKVKLTGPVVQFSRTKNAILSAPPLLGEHTAEILKSELKLSDDELNALSKEKVIECR